MPQMAPMLWSLLYFYPLSLILVCAIIMNFNKNFTLKHSKKMKHLNSIKNWAW
uniref:ATP synthase F0 subunit 8 n=1 Tax=Opiliones sp. MT-2014 TaxID=1560019 RepID=A0A0A0RV47_9ARAC|nr:ATP synthase F0 subunit 8 [Opiliones sp. MT-2014]